MSIYTGITPRMCSIWLQKMMRFCSTKQVVSNFPAFKVGFSGLKQGISYFLDSVMERVLACYFNKLTNKSDNFARGDSSPHRILSTIIV